MSLICYPAVFRKEKKKYWVEFPDLQGCFSEGKTIEDAYNNAKDALGLYLDSEGDLYKREINKPSAISKIIKENNKDVVMFVEFDSIEYTRSHTGID